MKQKDCMHSLLDSGVLLPVLLKIAKIKMKQQEIICVRVQKTSTEFTKLLLLSIA